MSGYDHRRLDPLVHSRVRLAVLSLLAGAESAAFPYIRDQVRTSDGNLATHLRKLEEAGYVAMEKEFVDRKPVTRYRLTGAGREALEAYVTGLEAILGSEVGEVGEVGDGSGRGSPSR